MEGHIHMIPIAMGGPGPTTSIAQHYGVSDREQAKTVHEIFLDCIKHRKKTEVIDKHFPNKLFASPENAAEVRAKIYAYAYARECFEEVRESVPWPMPDEIEDDDEDAEAAPTIVVDGMQ